MRYILIIIIIALIGCSDNGTEVNCKIEGGSIINLDIPDTVKVDHEFDIDITYGAPNLCYQFKEILTEFDNNNLTINAKICNNQKNNEDCPQKPLYGTTITSIVFLKTGVFNLFVNQDKFYKKVLVMK